MATTPELHEPQIAAARAQAWHQAGDPLLTLEAVRAFVHEHGFLLFAPRPLGAPAPSLVEATLGTSKPTVSAGEHQTARGLLARLVHDGFAVPLNLLGGPGDLPDFICSATAFPFVFTLRGDKGWKRPPETSGAVKVTPLALRVYEVLSERGAMAINEIVAEIGREVTESAVARALTELWSQLRVIPALQQGEGDTLWELTSARFVKGVKAGSNAGQPTALSALVSLYLGQALIATEEEIASFLSPLTARSRVREVLHGLVAGRQLDETVLEGKTVLYIPDSLPDFAQFATAEVSAEGAEGEPGPGAEPEQAGGEHEERGPIRRFGAGEGASRARDLRGKPAPREGGSRSPVKRAGSRDRSFGERGDRPRTDRPYRSDRPARSGSASGESERRPRPARSEGSAPRDREARPTRSDRPNYTRPWNEERRARPASPGGRPERAPREGNRLSSDRQGGGAERPYRREGDRPFKRREDTGDRPFKRREATGDRPVTRRRDDAGERPFKRREDTGDRPQTRRRVLPPELHESGHAERGPSHRRDDERGSRPDRGARARDDRGGQRGNFARDRQRTTGGLDRPRGERADRGAAGRPGGPARPFAGPRRERSGSTNSASEGRGFGDRSARGRSAPGGRPQRPGGDRPSPRSGGRGPAGGDQRGPGGFRPGAKRSAPAKRTGTPRPPRKTRPEDEA